MRQIPGEPTFKARRVTAKVTEKEGAARDTGEGLGVFTCTEQNKQCLICGASCFREAKGVENVKYPPGALFGN